MLGAMNWHHKPELLNQEHMANLADMVPAVSLFPQKVLWTDLPSLYHLQEKYLHDLFCILADRLTIRAGAHGHVGQDEGTISERLYIRSRSRG